MLKEYAVALVLSTATPVAADKQEGAKQAPQSQKETVNQPEYIRPKTGGAGGTLLAQGKINPFNIFQTQDALKEGEAAREGVRPEVKNPGFLDSILNRNSETQRMINELSSTNTDPGTLTASLGGGLMAPKSARFESATGSDAFAKSLGINTDVGGVNYGGLGSVREGGDYNPNANTSRAISDGTSGIGPISDGGQYAQNVMGARPTGNPNVMSPDGTFNRPGPGGPEPEADYTSYQPGSFYNQSDTNMNPTNFLRSARNVVTTPARMLGINNQFTNKLIPKSNEAIQDARDNRRPVTLTRRGGSGGARLPVAAALTPEEILLPEEVAPTEAPTYQQAGLDNNRLMQIQQEAYRQAYNPMTVGGFNPMFRFFGNRQGPRRGAFRRAFTRTA